MNTVMPCIYSLKSLAKELGVTHQYLLLLASKANGDHFAYKGFRIVRLAPRTWVAYPSDADITVVREEQD